MIVPKLQLKYKQKKEQQQNTTDEQTIKKT